tara:strand:- start:152 stop:616 length:465 start_codon:yes stop_codon:yes gene_type:complete
MKDNHSKNFKLISELSELMTKEKISLLVYEVSDLKLKIDKYESNQLKIENKKTEQEDNLLNERNSGVLDKIEYTSDHPGSIKSPMVGTAYASPEPGKSPFIRIGDQVNKGQPLVIIEAMKVMNTINAEKNGKVVFIGFEDGQPVEFDQLLVIIE